MKFYEQSNLHLNYTVNVDVSDIEGMNANSISICENSNYLALLGNTQ